MAIIWLGTGQWKNGQHDIQYTSSCYASSIKSNKKILKSFCYCQINVLPNPAVVRPGAVTALVRFTEGCMFWAILGRFPEKKFSIKFD